MIKNNMYVFCTYLRQIKFNCFKYVTFHKYIDIFKHFTCLKYGWSHDRFPSVSQYNPIHFTPHRLYIVTLELDIFKNILNYLLCKKYNKCE